MGTRAEEIASDWIALARIDSREASGDVFDRAWVIYDLARDDPSSAWDVIRLVVARYAESDLFSDSENEPKRVVGNTAAGPLEDLLATHGPQFIDAVELEARRDRRMMWTLGCVWQNAMTDEIWARVQRAAGGVSR